MLLSPARLNQLLRSEAGNTVVLDCTWFMPNVPRVAQAEFRTKRIPGSKFLDLDQVASAHELGLKHMLPTEEVFARACEKFGIKPSSRVVMYDTHGVFSSPRALWMMGTFGHQNSAILDGGLPRWEDEGFSLETNEPQEEKLQNIQYNSPTLDVRAVRSYEQIVSNSALIPFQTPDAELVFDARGRGRYLGTDPEPRPGLSSGHIPNSFSLPFNLFLQNNVAKNGSMYTTLLPEQQLRTAVVDALGSERANSVFNGDVPVIASCGSGMTAAVLWLGLKLLGVKQISIYDESWTGYSLRPSSKIEKSQ
ncbi:Rhodanese-like domain-containing protein [Mycena rosella]|uniref:Rhodanese-like domain-containing protein n=1 Tax=Mycena rosella TaxID=1033263 RepID=A0AAD7M963_MYCRO|nr:Rhodanese-like domain-containing protein [Mycena rosella]